MADAVNLAAGLESTRSFVFVDALFNAMVVVIVDIVEDGVACGVGRTDADADEVEVKAASGEGGALAELEVGDFNSSGNNGPS